MSNIVEETYARIDASNRGYARARETLGTELMVAIAFARIELHELEAGRRELHQCPGIENVAKAIAERAKEASVSLKGQKS